MSGLTALSAPGLFLTGVRYFELIQLGRNFQDDFGICVLQLRHVQRRFYRWGESVGITDQESPAYRLATHDRSDDLDLVDETLEAIVEQLSRAQKDAAGYARRLTKTSLGNAVEELDILDEDAQLASDTSIGSRSATRLRNSRVGKAYRRSLHFGDVLTGRTQWALYKKTEFSDLLTKITNLLNELEKALPGKLEDVARVDAQQLLVDQDGVEAPAEEVGTIIDVSVNTDPVFSAALNSITAKHGHVFESMIYKGYARAHNGDNYATIPIGGVASSGTYRKIVAGGNSRTHLGNNYGYAQQSSLLLQEDHSARNSGSEDSIPPAEGLAEDL
ncbi:unnamed protein product [Zymoseptoria tritici ST99CH_1E4]|uniref:Prion-inhibition and propagation HeLo domain-containing protein n=1 Tax=Zymoseptoria tritici ST99CH_1E4 TaxID=1276532 RepID=A0A2H1GTW8_ZYMTR|nr:unnamed protein product [Zymoseptoria tritici ST99CH_1E4]